MAAKGIDVSLHNGKLDWDAQRVSGVEFAIVKASQTGIKEAGGIKNTGTFMDPQFKRNQAEARRTMKRVGFYHYAHPEHVSGTEQARAFAKIVGPLRPGEFMALDFERRDLSQSVVVKFWQDFLTELDRITGRQAWVYTSASLANQYDLGKYFGNRPLWVVWYVTKDKPKLPKGWSGYHIWQYTDDNGMDKNIAGPGFLGPSLVDFLVVGAIVWFGLRHLHRTR